MFQSLFGSQAHRQTSALARRLDCEPLGDRIVPSASNLILNEIALNPPGSPDTGHEFVELRVLPGQTANLNNTWFVALEGEADGDAGEVDFAVNLTDEASNFASSGKSYIVIVDSTSTCPIDDDAYVIRVDGMNLENGASTYAIIQTASALDDLSTADLDTGGTVAAGGDGTLNLPAGAVLDDAVGFKENPSDFVYMLNGVGADVTVLPIPGSPDPDVIFRAGDSLNWYAGELLGEDDTCPNWVINVTFEGGPGFDDPISTTIGTANPND